MSHEDNNDDATIYVYGHAANAMVARAVTAVVNRYYAAATADDGVTACSLLSPSLAEAVPEDYGRGAGPAYLRGGKTCRAIMPLVFRHYRRQLMGAIRVIGVRVKHNHAYALLSSATFPFRFTELQREGGEWKVWELVGAELP